MSGNISSPTELWTCGTISQKKSSVLKNLNTFKNRLDKYWANQPMKYDFEAEYEFITRSESSKIQYEEQNILVQQCQCSEDP